MISLSNLSKVAISGLILSLAFSPFDCILALPISFAVLLTCLEMENSRYSIEIRDGLLVGFIFCFFHFVSSLFWIAHSLTIDIASFWCLIPITVICIPGDCALLMGVIIMLSYPYLRSSTRISSVLIFASLWTSMEIVRSHILLPFPWLFIGYTGVNYPSVMQLAPVIGVHGIGLFLIILSGVFFVRDKHFTLFVLTSCGILWSWSLLDLDVITKKETIALPISVIQPNSEQLFSVDEQKRYDILHNIHNMSKNATGRIIIWPESGIPFILPQDIKRIPILSSIVAQGNMLISGSDLYDGEYFYNSMLEITRDGVVEAIYNKAELVPFGEYVPWRGLLTKLPSVVMPYADFKSGSKRQANFTYHYHDNLGFNDKDPSNDAGLSTGDAIIKIAQYICYEIAFSPFIFSNIKDHTNLIVNITNDGWFGNTIGPYQHLAITQMRAAEYGLPVIRAANTGISAIIAPSGKIMKMAKLGISSIINYDIIIERHHKRTTYDLYSYYIALLIILATISVALLLPRDPRPKL